MSEQVNTTEITRRDFLSKRLLAGAGTVAGALVLGGYANLVEPNRIVVKHLELRLARLPEAFEGIRIAQISDLHFEQFVPASHVQHAVDEIIALKPDLLVITGDFVTRSWGSGGRYDRPAALKAAPCAAIVQKITPPLGSYAVLGNHDALTQPNLVTESLTAHGTTVLRNRAAPLEKDGARIWLAGVDDAAEDLADIPRTFKKVPFEEPTIALVHEPDVADEIARYSVDLQLSGHSHGGQVRIPLLGAPVLPTLARKYPMGLYKIGNMQLYTNAGLGMVTLPFRFDCPPEITLITLRSGR